MSDLAKTFNSFLDSEKLPILKALSDKPEKSQNPLEAHARQKKTANLKNHRIPQTTNILAHKIPKNHTQNQLSKCTIKGKNQRALTIIRHPNRNIFTCQFN